MILPNGAHTSLQKLKPGQLYGVFSALFYGVWEIKKVGRVFTDCLSYSSERSEPEWCYVDTQDIHRFMTYLGNILPAEVSEKSVE